MGLWDFVVIGLFVAQIAAGVTSVVLMAHFGKGLYQLGAQHVLQFLDRGKHLVNSGMAFYRANSAVGSDFAIALQRLSLAVRPQQYIERHKRTQNLPITYSTLLEGFGNALSAVRLGQRLMRPAKKSATKAQAVSAKKFAPTGFVSNISGWMRVGYSLWNRFQRS